MGNLKFIAQQRSPGRWSVAHHQNNEAGRGDKESETGTPSRPAEQGALAFQALPVRCGFHWTGEKLPLRPKSCEAGGRSVLAVPRASRPEAQAWGPPIEFSGVVVASRSPRRGSTGQWRDHAAGDKAVRPCAVTNLPAAGEAAPFVARVSVGAQGDWSGDVDEGGASL